MEGVLHVQKRKSPKGMLTYEEAASELCVSKRTFQRWVQEGRFPKKALFKIGQASYVRSKGLTKIMKGGDS